MTATKVTATTVQITLTIADGRGTMIRRLQRTVTAANAYDGFVAIAQEAAGGLPVPARRRAGGRRLPAEPGAHHQRRLRVGDALLPADREGPPPGQPGQHLRRPQSLPPALVHRLPERSPGADRRRRRRHLPGAARRGRSRGERPGALLQPGRQAVQEQPPPLRGPARPDRPAPVHPCHPSGPSGRQRRAPGRQPGGRHRRTAGRQAGGLLGQPRRRPPDGHRHHRLGRRGRRGAGRRHRGRARPGRRGGLHRHAAPLPRRTTPPRAWW